MLRRRFLRAGATVAAAPAVLPFFAPDPRLPAALRLLAERPLDGELRLHSNENPLGIAPAARQAAIEALDRANLYPSEGPRSVREALARIHGVEPEGIVLGNGSTELIQAAIQSLAAPGYRVVSAHPTFDDVRRYAGPSRVDLEAVPLAPDGQHDLTAMESAARRDAGPVLVYVCNPNNPTGTLTSCDDVAAFAAALPEDVHLLVDEAYFEYVDDPGYRSFDRMAFDEPRVVVLRTFSKVHGMAGMRLGYAVAHPDTAERLRAFTADNAADQLVTAAAAASLEEARHAARSVESNRRGRQVLEDHLDDLGIVRLPSHASFVMHRIRGDHADYVRRMRDAGFRVGRAFPPMLDHNRVSVGLPEDMERFGETLRDFRAKGWV